MSRTALAKKNVIISGVALVVIALPLALWQVSKDSKPNTTSSSTTSQVAQQQAPTTQISYQGEDGKTALELLKTHADVKSKNDPSLGEYVTSINGNDGGGTKYWLYYVDGKESAEGAGTYKTKASEKIEWKLQ